MKVKEITVSKEMKVGLPSFSNLTAHMSVTFEIAPGEAPDYDKAWDTVNQQLAYQVDGIEPSWMKTQEFAKFFKLTVKMPKLQTQKKV
jgi:hypothetical protein